MGVEFNAGHIHARLIKYGCQIDASSDGAIEYTPGTGALSTELLTLHTVCLIDKASLLCESILPKICNHGDTYHHTLSSHVQS